jgi:hypothetical protein
MANMCWVNFSFGNPPCTLPHVADGETDGVCNFTSKGKQEVPWFEIFWILPWVSFLWLILMYII